MIALVSFSMFKRLIADPVDAANLPQAGPRQFPACLLPAEGRPPTVQHRPRPSHHTSVEVCSESKEVCSGRTRRKDVSCLGLGCLAGFECHTLTESYCEGVHQYTQHCPRNGLPIIRWHAQDSRDVRIMHHTACKLHVTARARAPDWARSLGLWTETTIPHTH